VGRGEGRGGWWLGGPVGSGGGGGGGGRGGCRGTSRSAIRHIEEGRLPRCANSLARHGKPEIVTNYWRCQDEGRNLPGDVWLTRFSCC